jgi:hypothetical protein
MADRINAPHKLGVDRVGEVIRVLRGDNHAEAKRASLAHKWLQVGRILDAPRLVEDQQSLQLANLIAPHEVAMEPEQHDLRERIPDHLGVG